VRIRYITYNNDARTVLSNCFSIPSRIARTVSSRDCESAGTRIFPSQPEPIDPEAFSKQWPEYLAQSIATVNAPPETLPVADDAGYAGEDVPLRPITSGVMTL
jgi:hypothetical protein